MTQSTPRNVEEYLAQLRESMRGDDPALVQDALYDAEEYLRAELERHRGRPVSEVIGEIVASYGDPDEVAAAYRATEQAVNRALRPPRPQTRDSWLGSVFGVFADPRAYAAIFYMLLALATGVIYFTTVVAGLSMSLGLAITLIGIPFFLLFVGIVRVFSLVEGRVIESLLGVRMPRRPLYAQSGDGILARIGRMLTDPRTWTTMLYMALMLPLGVFYFAFTVAGFSVSVAAILAPLGWVTGHDYFHIHGHPAMGFGSTLLASVAGFIGVILMMHLCRLIGTGHGHLAKYLLVRQGEAAHH